MFGFQLTEIVDESTFFTIWRYKDVAMLARVQGVIDDRRSEEWRTAFLEHTRVSGWPRFGLVDIASIEPQNSFASRIRSAAFVRTVAKSLEWGGVLTGDSAGPLVVVRTVLRFAGMPNVSIFVDRDEFSRAVASCRVGQRPEAQRTL